MINKHLVAKRFSLRAREYDRYATLQWHMAQKLLLFSERLPLPSRILEIGCGTGRLTQALSLQFPSAHITAVDIAEGMIEVAKKRCEGLPITFLCGDAETLGYEAPFDLIVSNATFQWMEDLPAFFFKLHHILARGGTLIFSLFVQGTLSSLREAYTRAFFSLYGRVSSPSGIHFLSENDIHASLLAVFKREPFIFEKENHTPFYPDFRSLMQAVSRIGASGQQKELAPPRVIKSLADVYESQYRTPQGLPAEYNVLYVGIRRSYDTME
ncbi:MAG: methyltransferase domain-containing protein [Brevinematales bacterium]|nr:methyltransferase domain-containing protein [Brevinematales bacterium]